MFLAAQFGWLSSRLSGVLLWNGRPDTTNFGDLILQVQRHAGGLLVFYVFPRVLALSLSLSLSLSTVPKSPWEVVITSLGPPDAEKCTFYQSTYSEQKVVRTRPALTNRDTPRIVLASR